MKSAVRANQLLQSLQSEIRTPRSGSDAGLFLIYGSPRNLRDELTAQAAFSTRQASGPKARETAVRIVKSAQFFIGKTHIHRHRQLRTAHDDR